MYAIGSAKQMASSGDRDMSRFIKSPLSVLLSNFVWEIELIEDRVSVERGASCMALRYDSETGATWMQIRPCFGGAEDEGLRGYRKKDDASEAFVTTGTAMGAISVRLRCTANSEKI
jgi:hypothetical protein